MIGPATIKRTVKQTTGWAAVLSRPFTEKPAGVVATILYYHRVADLGFLDSKVDDWNVTPLQFERQISALKECAEIIPLTELNRHLETPSANVKPLVALTFDDGYANFYSEVLPILKRYQAPATAFVVTSEVDSPQPMPFDRWANRNLSRTQPDAWRPLSWLEVEACVDSGLVHIGAHSHKHLRGSQCTRAQMADEAGSSRDILCRRLGRQHATAYAYPYGNTKLGDVSPDYIRIVEEAGYQLAVTTDLGLVNIDSNCFSLPRLEAHMMDSPNVLKAKVTGALLPYRLTDHLRSAYRS
jgi:peptidoglycan/xylan/chitin deacetylase (PgdA/CDA1 family)